MSIESETPKEPFTWADLKKFANNLSDEQLPQAVELIEVDNESSVKVAYASEIGEDQYNFYEAEEVMARSDFDSRYHFEEKYKTFDEALANEPHSITPGTNVYLFDQ